MLEYPEGILELVQTHRERPGEPLVDRDMVFGSVGLLVFEIDAASRTDQSIDHVTMID